MKDVQEKFGSEVKTFPFAFVLDRHTPGWDSNQTDQVRGTGPDRRKPLPPKQLSGKSATYIDVKPRI